MRRSHWLRPNPKTVIPPWHICVATTTRPVPGSSGVRELDWAGWTVIRWDGRQPIDVCRGYESRGCDFWDAIRAALDVAKSAWIWFARPAQDMPALRLTELVAAGELVRDWWVWADPPVIVAGKLWGRKVRLLGMDNWTGTSAADLGQHFDAAAAAAAGGSASIGAHQPVATALARVRRCVSEILRFVRREDLGHLCSTVGAQALQSYRHLHMGEHKILVDGHAGALALERSCATGFPVRQHHRGSHADPIYTVDVNSLYPWVMANHPFPRKRIYIGPCESVAALRVSMGRYLCIARVSGRDTERDYVVKRANGSVMTDRLRDDVLCGPDLDSFVTRGHCDEVSEVACYEPAHLFDQWGQWAWDLRARYKQRGDAIGLAISKSLSVALWGKFAGRLGQWQAAPEGCPRPSDYGRFVWQREDGTVSECRAIAGVVDVLDGAAEPAVSCPAISAFVACYARAHMDALIAIARPSNVVYQVADALHLTDDGHKRLADAGLIDPSRFGALKSEGPFTDAIYHAPNIYRIGGRWRHAGKPVSARQTAGGAWRWESPATLEQGVLRKQTGAVPVVMHEVRLEL